MISRGGSVRTLSVAAGISLALTMAPLAAQAKQLNFSIGLGPGSAPVLAAEDYAASVKEASGGDLTIKVFPLELLSLPEMGPGIRDGLTDMGYLVTPYFPSEFSHSNFLADLSMLQVTFDHTGSEDLAYAGAMSEFITLNCPNCLEEFSKQNQVYLGHVASSPYALLCKNEISSAEDMKGKRLRAGGANQKRFAEHFGAIAVQIPANEAYEALSQGVIDCSMASLPELTNFRLMEVVNSITLGIPGNVWGGTAAGNINLDTWKSLSADERALMLQEAAGLAAGITWNYHAAHTENLGSAKTEGKSVIEPDADFVSAARDFVREDMKLVADLYKQNYKIDDAEDTQAQFAEILGRWTELTKGIEDRKALGELYWTEIFSKLDPETYGLN